MLKTLLIFVLSINLFAIDNLQPSKVFTASGSVQSIVIDRNMLYAGTINGTVEIFDTDKNKKIKTIKIPDIKDFMGDDIPAKIYSIDLFNEMILIVSQGMKGYGNIFIYADNKLNKIIDINKKYFIQKASFVDDEKIVFALLSNQVGVYNFKRKKLDYLIQVSPSSFSHFMISEDKKNIATTDESGIVRIMDIESSQVIREPKALNLDRVYQVDYKNGVILTAGQDRKSVIYKESSSSFLDFHFLLYSCGLSPKAKLGAVAYNEQNEVLVFDVDSKRKLYNLKGQKATLTQILFKNEEEIFVSSEDPNINYFKLH
jgi:WD40 repeat protein